MCSTDIKCSLDLGVFLIVIEYVCVSVLKQLDLQVPNRKSTGKRIVAGRPGGGDGGGGGGAGEYGVRNPGKHVGVQGLAPTKYHTVSALARCGRERRSA